MWMSPNHSLMVQLAVHYGILLEYSTTRPAVYSMSNVVFNMHIPSFLLFEDNLPIMKKIKTIYFIGTDDTGK